MTQESVHQPRSSRQRATAAAWLALLAALVLYGSWIPFQFRRFTSAGPAFDFSAIAVLPPTSRGDLLVNLLAYFPIGWAAAAVLSSRATIARRASASLACGFILSLVVEWVQTAMPDRVASWMDVGLNAAGAAAGAAVWPLLLRTGQTLRRCCQQEWIRRPLMAAAVILSTAVLIVGVIPSDFIRTTEQLHDALLRADWTLTLRLEAGWAAALIHRAADAAWFAVIGYCTAFGRRRQGWAKTDALASATKHGVVVACVLTAVQLLCAGHVFRLAEPIWRVTAALIGALFGGGCRFSPIPTPRMAFVAFGMMVAADWVVQSTGSFAFFAADPATARLWAVPFESLWRTPLTHAVREAASTLLVFAVLVSAMRLWLADWPAARAWTAAIGFAVALSLGMEWSQLSVPGQTADLTDPVLALLTGLLLSWTARRMRLGLSAELTRLVERRTSAPASAAGN
ncbi:MAG: hypothetical protein C4547_13720 [Phycisphaerales bacterium]|nr:MAG: hypothetical protein C4547_13720 [Phycisphaerales bacterium]